MFAALPRAAQQHPDLRIHVGHLVARHPKEAAVHPLLAVVADQPLPGAAEAAGAREAADRLVAATVAFGDMLPDDLPLAEEAPEIVVRAYAAGHPVGISDNGDGGAGVHVRFTRTVTISTLWYWWCLTEAA